MARKGFKSMTVSDRVHLRLANGAKATHRSVPKFIESMLDELYPEEAAG